MTSRLPAVFLALLLSLGCASTHYPDRTEQVGLRAYEPVRFVAGQDAELSFELVATNPDGETRRLETDLFPEAKITAEFSFFCFGGTKVGEPVTLLEVDDGLFRTRVQIPRAAVSADLALSIDPLPDDVTSEFRDPYLLVSDQTVEARRP